MVKFAKEVTERGHSTYDHNYATYMKVAREGIVVGLRRYHFFGTLLMLSYGEFGLPVFVK